MSKNILKKLPSQNIFSISIQLLTLWKKILKFWIFLKILYLFEKKKENS